jgi:hypothetical protein
LGKKGGDKLGGPEDKYFRRVEGREFQSLKSPEVRSRSDSLITGGHATTDPEVRHSGRNIVQSYFEDLQRLEALNLIPTLHWRGRVAQDLAVQGLDTSITLICCVDKE